MNSAKGVVVSIVPTFSQRGSLWGEGTFSPETLWRRLTFRSLARESWSCSEGFTDPFGFMVHDNRDDQTVVLLIRLNFIEAKVCVPLSRDVRATHAALDIYKPIPLSIPLNYIYTVFIGTMNSIVSGSYHQLLHLNIQDRSGEMQI